MPLNKIELMNKITAVVEKSGAKIVESFLKKNDISKFFRVLGKSNYKYEFIVTDLKTQDLLEELKVSLNGSGFITVNPTNLIYPCVEEKGAKKNLEELILKGAKNFIKIDKNFILFTLCASIIACLGFQINSLPVLISAMIICPLMSPIMASSYAIVSKNAQILIKGFRAESIGILLIIIFSLTMSLFPNSSLSLELSFASADLFHSFFIALIIGVVSANAFLSGKLESLTGAAVGISLLPPITNAILLFASGELYYSINSILIFSLNLLGIHWGSIGLFWAFRK